MTDFLWIFGLMAVAAVLGLIPWVALLIFEGVFLDSDD